MSPFHYWCTVQVNLHIISHFTLHSSFSILYFRFLRCLLESSQQNDNGLYQIFLPDVEKHHMEVVLKFLYSGRLKLCSGTVEAVRDLLQKVLRIDADFKIPIDETKSSSQTQDPSSREGDGGGGSFHGSPPASFSGNQNGSNDAPPKKRFCPSGSHPGSIEDSVRAPPMTPPHELEYAPLDDEEIQVLTPPPKTPPPIVDLSDNEEVEASDEKIKDSEEPQTSAQIDQEVSASPPATSLSYDQNLSATPNNHAMPQSPSGTSIFESLQLAPAPRIIAKKTGCPQVSTVKQPIPPAPCIVAKRTGKRGRSSKQEPPNQPKTAEEPAIATTSGLSQQQSTLFESLQLTPKPKSVEHQHLENESIRSPTAQDQAEDSPPSPDLDVYDFHDDFSPAKKKRKRGRPSKDKTQPIENETAIGAEAEQSISSPVASTSGRATRTRTGVIRRTDFSDYISDISDIEDNEASTDPDFDAAIEVGDQLEARSFLNSINMPPVLPPPIPEAPEPGLVLYRGEWMKPEKVNRLKMKTQMRKQNVSRAVRRYNPNNATITGKTMESMAKYRNEPEGRHECKECHAVFAVSRSLEVHYSREHNPKAIYECPEGCGKKFTNKGAIPKHLLSHRPENQWPFQCLFCNKRFQARADLPKHFKTSKHIGDPRIPKCGTEEWKELMRRSEVVPWRTIKTNVYNTYPESSRSTTPNSLVPEVPSPPLEIEPKEEPSNSIEMPVLSPQEAPTQFELIFESTAACQASEKFLSQPTTSKNVESSDNVITENDALVVASSLATTEVSKTADDEEDDLIPDFEPEDEFLDS